MTQNHLIGERIDIGGTEHILAQVEREKFALINLENGNRHMDSVPCSVYYVETEQGEKPAINHTDFQRLVDYDLNINS